jgi:hypothetical protein
MNVTTGKPGRQAFVTGGVYGVLFLLGAVEGAIGSFQYSRRPGRYRWPPSRSALRAAGDVLAGGVGHARGQRRARARHRLDRRLIRAVHAGLQRQRHHHRVGPGRVVPVRRHLSAVIAVAASFGRWIRAARRGAAEDRGVAADRSRSERRRPGLVPPGHGQFAGGIVVVTTSAGHAMTVSAFTSVSLEPPLVLFCAEKIARFHDAVLAAGSWAVSILAEDAEKTARWLATRGRPLDGQLDAPPGSGHRRAAARRRAGHPGVPDHRRARRRRSQHHRRPGRGGQPARQGRRPASARWCTTPAPTAVCPGAKSTVARELTHRFFDPVEPPVEIFLADDQRRRQPDHVPVGFLGQDAVLGEPLADLPARQRGELDTCPQSRGRSRSAPRQAGARRAARASASRAPPPGPGTRRCAASR